MIEAISPNRLLFLGAVTICTMACGSSSGEGASTSIGGTSTANGGTVGSATGGSSSSSVTGGTTSGGTQATGGAAVGQGGGQTTQSGGMSTTGGAVGSNNGGATAGGATSAATGGGTGGGTGGATSIATGGASGRPAGGTSGGAIGGKGSGGSIGTGGTTKASGGTSGGGAIGNGGSPTSGGAIGNGGGTATSNATIVPDPSWACGMAAGIPAPELGTLLFRATLQLGETHDVGNTQFGHRRILDVKGGTLTGDRVQATFMNLGLDLELTLSNGAVELEQINILKASDGTLIYMRNCGVAPAGDSTVRVVADFEVATSKSLAWLNTGKYVGTRKVDASARTLQLDVYDVTNVTAGEPKITLKDPAGVPNVSWDCPAGSGSQGATVFTENVTLGSSISIGTTKRGNRNIIPITGGTTTGKVAGSILPGGGDYQLGGLDARYTLAPTGGEFILVRNCGSGTLYPVFEARADGPFAYLNENKYISSAPGVGSGGVSITFYERK